jgi:hypothetical protein
MVAQYPCGRDFAILTFLSPVTHDLTGSKLGSYKIQVAYKMFCACPDHERDTYEVQ